MHSLAGKRGKPFKPAPFFSSGSKAKIQKVVSESISEVYTEKSQEKHLEQQRHTLRPSETHTSMGEVKVMNNLQW